MTVPFCTYSRLISARVPPVDALLLVTNCVTTVKGLLVSTVSPGP